MKNFYQISKDSLIELSKRIYEEACGGYMDLRDSACEKFIEDFLADKDDVKKLNDTNLNEANLIYANHITSGATSGAMEWQTGQTVTWPSTSTGNWDSGIGVPAYIVGADPALETAGMVTITNNTSIPQATYNVDIVLRNPDQEMLRANNYYGNESERM